ncbi:MAG: hypothetical protein QOK44_5159 [Betaproteobacteria bacterium]|nr:hypothetical protein [Betaproteobacteria bacterium]
MNRVWLFRCVNQSGETVATHVWQWRVEARDGTVSVSRRTFHTLPECVADAKLEGFMGEVDATTGTFMTHYYEVQVGDFGDIVLRPRAQPND